MSGTDVAADVPTKFDVVIDGFGYVTARAVDPNMPFRVQEENLSYTPTFLERTNVSGNYGDDSQAFFLTASQDDWSEGEDQRFLRLKDADSTRRYWLGSNIDVTVPGQATIRPTTTAVSLSASVSGVYGQLHGAFFTASTTNLYEISTTGTVTDRGAHGCGAQATTICSDGTGVLYLSGSGCTKTRQYDTTAHTFSDFGTNVPAYSLTYLNNSLWGSHVLGTNISYYSTAGVPTAAYSWKGATGADAAAPKIILPLGGKIAALMQAAFRPTGAEVWIGDTTGMSRLAELPALFSESTMTQVNGIIFVAGTEPNGNLGCRTVIYYIQNGTLGRLWASQNWNSGFASAGVGIAPFQNGLVFTDVANSAIRYYDLGLGATSVIASYTPSAQDTYIGTNDKGFLLTQATANTVLFASNAATATSGSIKSSLIDFDNSLTKLFRGIKVDFSAATDGNGGSVDIAYQVDSLDGSYTTLQTGATSGTEYALSSLSGHTLSVKITLNKGTSTFGPTLKRVYLRGVPVLQAYRVNEYILDLGGDATTGVTVKRRDMSDHNLSGEAMRANLAATITAATPVSVTDRTGTFTAVLEPANCEFDQTRPSQWYARIRVREV